MKKRKLLLSALSLVLVFCLLAGGTMAWFTDTEKADANFSAGVLDITLTPGEQTNVPLTFQNLRPMTFEAFRAEINAAGNGNNHTEGYGYAPQYFQPVVVKNVGTLPVLIAVSAEAWNMEQHRCPGDGEDAITLGEKDNPGKVAWDKDGKDGTCENKLSEVLHLVLFEKVGGEWTVVAENLNPGTGGAPYEPGVVLPAAKGEKTYVVGAYLPGETVGNEYQGKHFHGSIVVNAMQTDVGAGVPDQPELPEMTREVTVQWTANDGVDVLGSYKTQVTFPEGKETVTLAPDLTKLPEGYVLADPDANATIGRGEQEVRFLVAPVKPPLPEMTQEVTINLMKRDSSEIVGSHKLTVTFPEGEESVILTSDQLGIPEGYGWPDPNVDATISRGELEKTFLVAPVVIIGPTDPEYPEVTKNIDVRWYLGDYAGDVQEILKIDSIEVTIPEGKDSFTLVYLLNLTPPEGYVWADRPISPAPDYKPASPVFRDTEKIDMRVKRG